MADVIKYRFRCRRRTAAQWTAVNEILLDSEIGLEDDTGLGKIGDGATAWNDLLYTIVGRVDLSGLQDGFTLKWNTTAGNWETGKGGGAGTILSPAGSSYTFGADDNGATVISGSAGAFTLNIPTDASVALDVGTRIGYSQGAAGSITVAATDPLTTTVHAANGNTTHAVWDGGVAEKIGPNEWQLWNGPLLSVLATAADAPSDGKNYGRKDGGWAEIVTSSGGLDGVNEQTGTTYTLGLTDKNKAIRCTNAAAITLTIPTNASVALPVLTSIPIFQGGAGAVAISGASGVTIESPNGTVTTGIGDFRTLFQRATDVWVIG